MQKIFEARFNGQASSFKPVKISRSKLYGSKKRIPVDAQGQECFRAALTRDGKYILPIGGTALLYLTDDGDVAERNQLRGIDADEDEIAPEGSSHGAGPEIVQIVTVAEILECSITCAYVLEPVFICSELEKLLSLEKIHRLPDVSNRQRFLIGNSVGYFLLVGEHTGFDFIGLAEADFSPPDYDNEETEDDLDFYML